MKIIIYLNFIFLSYVNASEEDGNECINKILATEKYQNLIIKSNKNYLDFKANIDPSKLIDAEWEKYNEISRISLSKFYLGDYEEGIKLSLDSYEFAKNSQEAFPEVLSGIALSRVGINLYRLGYVEASKACHQIAYSALLDYRANEDDLYLSHLAWEQLNLSRLYIETDELDLSEKFIKDAKNNFSIVLSKSDPKDKDKFINYYLNALAEQASLQLKRGYTEDALNIIEDYKSKTDPDFDIYPAFGAYAGEVFSRVFLEAGNLILAEDEIKKSKNILKELPYYYLHPLLDLTQSKIYQKRGNLNEALDSSLKAINFIEKSWIEGYAETESFFNLNKKVNNIYTNHFSIASKISNNNKVIKDSFFILQKTDLKRFGSKLSLISDKKNTYLDRSDHVLAQKIVLKQRECKEIISNYHQQAQDMSLDEMRSLEFAEKLTNCVEQKEKLSQKTFDNDRIRAFLNPSPVETDQWIKELEENEALISFFFDRDSSFVWLIDKNNSIIHKIDSSLEALINSRNRLRETLSLKKGNLEPFAVDASYELYEILLLPVLEKIINIDTLIFIKNDFFRGIPFSVLVTNRSRVNYPSFLFESFDINNIYLASELVERNVEITSGSFYGFGDPIPKDNLPRLDGAEDELKALGLSFRSPWSNIYLKDKANKESLSNLSIDNGILAFATHAVIPSGLTKINEPSLLLKNWLSASEIAFDMELSSSLVLLSACETGWISYNDKQPTLDLPSAFILSGSKSVMVTNWIIEDQATKNIMVSAADYIYKNPNKDNLFSKALRKGMKDYINANRTRESISMPKSHPFFWAPFELIGLPLIAQEQ